jgi:hypothetical protein
MRGLLSTFGAATENDPWGLKCGVRSTRPAASGKKLSATHCSRCDFIRACVDLAERFVVRQCRVGGITSWLQSLPNKPPRRPP